MTIYFDKLRRIDGDSSTGDYYVLYEHGHFTKPIAILSQWDVEKLSQDVIAKYIGETFTLIFGTLAEAEHEGLSLEEANQLLEEVISERHGFDHSTIIGFIAKYALENMEEEK